MDLSSLLTSRTAAIIGLVCIALSALAALWAMVKLSYQRALGKPMPRNALTATLDVLAELAVNVVGAVSRGLKLGTGEGLFRSTLPLTPELEGVLRLTLPWMPRPVWPEWCRRLYALKAGVLVHADGSPFRAALGKAPPVARIAPMIASAPRT